MKRLFGILDVVAAVMITASVLSGGIILVGASTSACASAATRHPLLDPVGQKASYALDVLTVAEKASATIRDAVIAGTLKMSQTVANTLNLLSYVGDACRDIGVLLDAYNLAIDGVARVKAAADVNAKIEVLGTLVAGLPAADIGQASKELADKVKTLQQNRLTVAKTQ